MDVLLDRKNAMIYGAGGAVGGAIARAFAADGARVFLAGRTLANVQAVAADISAAGGSVEVAQVDALDEHAVEQHVQGVAAQTGRIDILFNAIGMADIQGTPLLEMSLEDLAQPVVYATKTQFLTARAVARYMVAQGSGVVMSITAEPTPGPNLGGFPAACAAIEGLWRSLAVELGPHGVRTVVIRSPGSPDAPGVQDVYRLHAAATSAPFDIDQADAGQAEAGIATLLGRLPMLAEVANAATILASDRASAMTAVIANVTCGAFIDL